MKSRLPKLSAYICLWMPFAAVLIKNALLQGYVTGDNAYTVNIWRGFVQLLPSFPLLLAVMALLAAPCFLFKDKGRYRYGLILNAVLSVILVIDLVYFRCYNVMPSAIMLPLVGTQGGAQSIADALPTLFAWSDLWFLADFIPWSVLHTVCRRRGWLYPWKNRRPMISGIVAGVSALVLTAVPLLSLFGADGGLFRRLYVTSDSIQRTQYFSSAGFHGADLVQTLFGKVTDGEFSKTDEQAYEAYFEWKNQDTTDSEYVGRFKGKNLLIIQIESLESFLLGRSIGGQAITPNLNRLIDGGYYFPNIHEQVKCGNSSDCDFMVMTGLLPPNRGYVFGTFADRKYLSLSTILKKNGGYTSYYFHGASNSTWNYEEMLNGALKMDQLMMNYTQDEKLNGYLADESFVDQTIAKLEQQPLSEPFYAHVVTCSSHIPCHVPQDFEKLNMPEELEKNPLGRYFNAVHYADEQIGRLLDELEKDGVLRNTLIAVIGDHGGVHKYYPQYIDDLSEEVYEDWFGHTSQYTVPMILYSEDIADPRQFDVIGGQVDILPTLLSALGIEEPSVQTTMFGRDLFSTSRSFALRDDGELYGTLSEADHTIAKTMFYLSDLAIRSDRCG